jgi:hypothetical protein
MAGCYQAEHPISRDDRLTGKAVASASLKQLNDPIFSTYPAVLLSASRLQR